MSADINSVTIVGRLTRDAELKYTNSGFAISSISIAVNRSKKDGDQWVEEGNFFDVTLLGRRGESLNQYLQKGIRIAVTGELKQERWEKDGQKRSRVIIQANNVQLLGSPQGGDQNNSNHNNSNNSQSNNNRQGGGNPPSNQQHGRGSYNNSQSNNQGNNRPPGNNQNNKPSYENYPSGNGGGGNGNFEDDIPF